MNEGMLLREMARGKTAQATKQVRTNTTSHILQQCHTGSCRMLQGSINGQTGSALMQFSTVEASAAGWWVGDRTQRSCAFGGSHCVSCLTIYVQHLFLRTPPCGMRILYYRLVRIAHSWPAMHFRALLVHRRTLQ